MKTDSGTKTGHNYGLDYIRIFAMLSVLWVHLTVYINVSDSVRPLFTWGANGVYIFFALSGFLAAKSFQSEMSTKEYYIKRAIRILPSYYVGIVAMIIITYIVSGGGYSDVFHLGWIRYFLGLNTILPSNNYDIWNNLYGYWTMSCFIWFYVLAPLIFKFVKSFKATMEFIVISFGVFVAWRFIAGAIFSGIDGLENLNVLIGTSPFATLYYFAFGILTYYTIKENRKLRCAVIVALFGIAGILINRNAWCWCAIACLAIMFCYSFEFESKQNGWNKFISWLSGQSFYIYLSHLMAFDLSWLIVDKYMTVSGNLKYLMWGGVLHHTNLSDRSLYEYG